MWKVTMGKARFFEFTYLPENIPLDPRPKLTRKLCIRSRPPFVASFLLIGLLDKKNGILQSTVHLRKSL